MSEKFLKVKAFVVKYGNILFFIGGFIFDTFTMVRVDSVADLALETIYLLAITFLIVWQTRYALGLWVPRGRMEKLWEYESEAIHFFYGGLLSANVIFYFKSTTFSRSVFFFALVVLLMVANEMPQVRKAGHAMRLGLYTFCVVSFFNYLIPVIVGRMGGLIFSVGWIVAAIISAILVEYLAKLAPDRRRARWRYGWSPASIMIIVAALYAAKLIPPVPLSMQYAGIFQNVIKDGDKFRLVYEKPSWYTFWRKDNRHFHARPGDQIFCFTRVFAPRHFTHQIYVAWFKKNEVTGEWMSSDRIPLAIFGGREDGFRGYTVKSNYEPGVWRVDIETEDGRTLGGVKLEVTPDNSTEPRKFKEIRM